jgi:hypothetical protein
VTRGSDPPSDRERAPSEADGPLLRAAYRQAERVDRAQKPAERRKAWAGVLGAGVVALAEGFLREQMIWGAVLFSILGAVFGATSGDLVWAIPMVASGVVGILLVFLSQARRWAFGRQWGLLLGVVALQCVLIVVLWKAH